MAISKFTKVNIPEIKLEARSAFDKAEIVLDEDVLSPKMVYSNFWEVSLIEGRQITEIENRNLLIDNFVTLEEVTLLKTGLSTHSDVFSSDDNDSLALAIATTGVTQNVGRILMMMDQVRKVVDHLVPDNNVRNRLSSKVKLITYEQVLAEADKFISATGLNISNPVQRKYLTLVVGEILFRVLGTYVGIARHRNIAVERPVYEMFPKRGQLALFMQAGYIRDSLASLNAVLDNNRPKTDLSYEVVVNNVAETLCTLGRSLLVTTSRNDALEIAAGVVKWFIMSPLIPDFPEEMKGNPALQTLAANATFLRYAMDCAPSSVVERMSAWTHALDEVLKSLRDAAFFKTMRLSDFARFCGHCHINGPRDEIKALMFWMNIPGSSKPLAFLNATVDSRTNIGEAAMLEEVDTTMGALVHTISRRCAQDWVAELQTYLAHAITEDFRYSELPEFSGEGGFDETGKENTKIGALEKPMYVRYSAPVEAAWYYAAALTRRIYPRFVEGDVVAWDFIVPMEHVNVNLTVPIHQGLIRTDDPRIVMLGSKPQSSLELFPCLTDGLPEKDRDGLLFLDTVPVFPEFNTMGINWNVALTNGEVVKLTTANWLTMIGQPSLPDIRFTDLTRSRMLLNAYDDILDATTRWIVRTPQTDLLLAKMKAFVLRDLTTDSSIALSINRGIQMSIIRRIGDPLARARMKSEFGQNAFNLRMLTLLGAEVLRQAGLLSSRQVDGWLDLLQNTKWYVISGVLEATPRKLGTPRV